MCKTEPDAVLTSTFFKGCTASAFCGLENNSIGLIAYSLMIHCLKKKTLATEYKNTSNYNTRAHLQSVQDRTRGCSNINLFRGLRQISILRFTNNRWWKNITVKKIIAYSLSLISWATSKEKKIHATRSSMIISKAHLESAGVRIFTLSLSRLCFDESSFSGGWRRALWRWAAKGPSASSGSRIDQFTD